MRKIYKINTNKTARAKSFDGYIKLLIPTFSLVILAGLMSYVVLTSVTFWTASKYSAYDKDIALKTATILDLETKLSSINKEITPTLAYSKGFKDSHSVKYITTKSITKVTSANEI